MAVSPETKRLEIIVQSIWLGLYTLFSFISIGFFIYNGIFKKRDPIRSRHPIFVIIGFVICTIGIYHQTFVVILDYPFSCLFDLQLDFFVFISQFNIMMIRAIQLFTTFRATENLVSERQIRHQKILEFERKNQFAQLPSKYTRHNLPKDSNFAKSFSILVCTTSHPDIMSNKSMIDLYNAKNEDNYIDKGSKKIDPQNQHSVAKQNDSKSFKERLINCLCCYRNLNFLTLVKEKHKQFIVWQNQKNLKFWRRVLMIPFIFVTLITFINPIMETVTKKLEVEYHFIPLIPSASNLNNTSVNFIAPPKLSVARCLSLLDSSIIYISVFSAIYLFVFIVFGVKLTHRKDAFGIKTELLVSGIFGFIFMTLIFILTRTDKLHIINDTYNISMMLEHIQFFSIVVLSVFVPLVQSYSKRQTDYENSKTSTTARIPLSKFVKNVKQKQINDGKKQIGKKDQHAVDIDKTEDEEEGKSNDDSITNNENNSDILKGQIKRNFSLVKIGEEKLNKSDSEKIDEVENNIETKDHSSVINRERDSGSLVSIMNDFKARNEFYEYLVTEFSVQHFHFQEDSRELLSISSALIDKNLIFDDLFNNLISFVKNLYDSHVSNNLDFGINISNTLRDRLTVLDKRICQYIDRNLKNMRTEILGSQRQSLVRISSSIIFSENNGDNDALPSSNINQTDDLTKSQHFNEKLRYQLINDIQQSYGKANKEVYKMLRNSYRRYRRRQRNIS